MAIFFFSGFLGGEQQPPAELEMGQTFLVAPDILLEQLPELGVFLAADQVQLHGEFIPGGHHISQRLVQPVPELLPACGRQAVILFLEFGTHSAGVGGDQLAFFQLPEFRIHLAVPGVPEISHFLPEKFFHVVAGQVPFGQEPQEDVLESVFFCH